MAEVLFGYGRRTVGLECDVCQAVKLIARAGLEDADALAVAELAGWIAGPAGHLCPVCVSCEEAALQRQRSEARRVAASVRLAPVLELEAAA